MLLTAHVLSSLTEICDELIVLASGTVQRRYTRAEFGQVAAALLAGEYQQKVAQLELLLPEN